MESIFIPERLKKIRENRGLNKAEAARLLGLSKMGYLRYESADRTPSHQIIQFRHTVSHSLNLRYIYCIKRLFYNQL